jgi:hypothetical protein
MLPDVPGTVPVQYAGHRSDIPIAAFATPARGASGCPSILKLGGAITRYRMLTQFLAQKLQDIVVSGRIYSYIGGGGLYAAGVT